MGDECELIVRTARVWVPLLKTFLENEFSKSNANDKWFKNISAPLRINDDEIILWEHFETLWDTVTACSQKVEMWKNENNFETPKKKICNFLGINGSNVMKLVLSHFIFILFFVTRYMFLRNINLYFSFKTNHQKAHTHTTDKLGMQFQRRRVLVKKFPPQLKYFFIGAELCATKIYH